MKENQNKAEHDQKHGRLLITGSKGTIGTVLSKSLIDSFDIIQLDINANGNNETEFTSDISDLQQLDLAFQKMHPIDYIVHLAGNPNPEAPWEEILKSNIIGTKNIYECSRRYGVKKVIFASSTHLFGAYEGYPQTSPLERPIEVNDPPRPDSDYGTSKGFGELLARQYYDLYGVQTICIRIGAVSKDNKAVKPFEKLWLSHRDVSQVFKRALLNNVPFGIYFATSDNPQVIFDITKTKNDLGYNPQDTYSPD